MTARSIKTSLRGIQTCHARSSHRLSAALPNPPVSDPVHGWVQLLQFSLAHPWLPTIKPALCWRRGLRSMLCPTSNAGLVAYAGVKPLPASPLSVRSSTTLAAAPIAPTVLGPPAAAAASVAADALPSSVDALPCGDTRQAHAAALRQWVRAHLIPTATCCDRWGSADPVQAMSSQRAFSRTLNPDLTTSSICSQDNS